MTTQNTQEALIELQKTLESSAVLEGIERYQKEVEAKGAAESLAGTVVVKHAIEPVVDALRQVLADAATGKANRSGAYLKFLNFIDLHTAAFIGINRVFTQLNTTETTIKTRIGAALEDEMNVQAFRSGFGSEEGDREGLFQYFVEQMNKRSSKANRRMYLQRGMAHVEGFKKIDWNDETKSRIGGVVLDCVLSVNNLFVKTMRTERSRGQMQTVRYIEPTPELLAKMSELNKFFAVQRPVYGPMIVPPLEWDRSLRGGYLTKRLPLIKSANTNYMTDAVNNGRLDNVFKAVNTLQNTAWAVNTRVLETAQYMWALSARTTVVRKTKDEGAGYKTKGLGGLPARGELDKPALPAGVSIEQLKDEQPELWAEWKRDTADYYGYKNSPERLGAIFETNTKLNIAARYAQYEALYFVHQLDFRGRIYPVATGLNPQGDDLSHGLLEFANGKYMTEDAATWLAVHGANCWANGGLDKDTFTNRVQFVQDHESLILASAKDPVGCTWWANAECPWMFLAFCFEWAGWKEDGENHLTTLPIYADGSCNGIQHYAALMRDETEGGHVNLTPGEKPQDIYKVVAAAAQAIVQRDTIEGDALEDDGEVRSFKMPRKELAKLWQPFVNRKLVKRAVMTKPYGSTQFGVRDQLKGDFRDILHLWDKSVQKVALSYMTSVIIEAIGTAVSSATLGMKYLQDTAKVAAETNLPLLWTTYDGFVVQVAHTKKKSRRIRTTLTGGVNVRQNAVTAIRKALEAKLEKEHGEVTAWSVLGTLTYEFVRGAVTEPDFLTACRDLLTGEHTPEVIDLTVATLTAQLKGQLAESEEVDEDGKVVVSTNLVEPTDELDKVKQKGGIGPHFVHAADATHLRLTVNACADLGIVSFAAVHDSFGVHATDFALMGQVLREQFVEMHQADLFAMFRGDIAQMLPDELKAQLPEVPPKGNLDLQQVLVSDYLFA